MARQCVQFLLSQLGRRGPSARCSGNGSNPPPPPPACTGHQRCMATAARPAAAAACSWHTVAVGECNIQQHPRPSQQHVGLHACSRWQHCHPQPVGVGSCKCTHNRAPTCTQPVFSKRDSLCGCRRSHTCARQRRQLVVVLPGLSALLHLHGGAVAVVMSRLLSLLRTLTALLSQLRAEFTTCSSARFVALSCSCGFLAFPKCRVTMHGRSLHKSQARGVTTNAPLLRSEKNYSKPRNKGRKT